MKYKACLGIDVSKRTLDVAIRSDQHTEPVHGKFTNNQKGFSDLLKWVKTHLKVDESLILGCMEHSGFYCLPAVCFLNKQGIDVCIEHPYQIKHSMGLQRNKTDKADAKIIARYCWLHREELKPTKLPGNVILKLQALLAYRDRLVEAKKGFKCALLPLVDFTDHEVHDFVKVESEVFVKQITEKIKRVEQEINDLIKSSEEVNENFKLITSIKGIGTFIAAHVIVYTHNFKSITRGRKFACYCGIAPFERSSGTSLNYKPRVSHLANKKMKALLNLGGWMALQRDTELKAYYNRKLKEGKHPLCAINAVRNKLVARIFAVVNRKSPFVSIANYG